jgi:cell division protein FtsB
MTTRRRVFRSRSSRRINWWVLLAAFLGMVLVILAVRLVFGDRGFLSLVRKQRQEAEISAEVDAATRQRLEMDSKVKLLQDGSLDLDMLEEQAKKNLGYAHPDERVILLKPEGEAKQDKPISPPVAGE